MRKRNGYYRKPRTTAERKANQDREFVRGKRLPKNLPSAWDDIHMTITNSWKDRRKTQYRVSGRGKKHEYIIETEKHIYGLYNLEQHFKKNDIPYRIERLVKTEKRLQHYGSKYAVVGGHWVTYQRKVRKPKTKNKNLTEYETVRYWVDDYAWVKVKLDKPREIKVATNIGYKIVWWSNKNIDIEWLLNSIVGRTRIYN